MILHDRGDGPKIVYLARRHPFLDHALFVARWRAHGVLSQRLDGWGGVRCYEQNEAIALAPDVRAAIPGAAADYDGVGIGWFRDDAAIHGYDGDQKLLRRDELQTFGDVVAGASFVSRERIARGDRRCGVKIVSLLHPRGRDDGDFRRALARLADALLHTTGFSEHVVKYVESLPIALGYPGGDRPGLQDHGAALEVGFRDAARLTAALAHPNYRAAVLPAWRDAAGGRGISVAVKEVRLYDEGAGAASGIQPSARSSRQSSVGIGNA